MWFSFGIISLSLFTIYFTYKKINASWKGESIQLGQKSCKFKKTRPIIGSADALIGINSAKGIDYIFKREGWFDRVFKSLGLVNEHQVGNPKFDDLVFIVSDDVSLHQQLSKNSVIVSTVLDIFSCVDNSTFSVKQIRHNSGCLWVKLGAHIKFTEEDIKELTPKFAPLLETLSEEMQKISGHSKPLWKRPQSFISAALLGISTALAVTGYIQFKRLSLSLPDLPHVIDANLMLNHAIMLGGAFVLLLVVLTVYLLGRSPRTHLVLLEVILLGGFGAFMTSFSELNHFNHTYDETSVQIFEARVLDKKKVSSRKSTGYYLYTDDWIGSNKSIQIRVPYNIYLESSVGTELVLLQKAGALGYRWLSEIMVKSKLNTEPINSTKSFGVHCADAGGLDCKRLESLKALYQKAEYKKQKQH